MALSRTYNSQLAVSESTPGSFGYGWTSSYSTHLVVNTEAKTATVHQDNGSTVPFREVAAGRYEPGNPLVQATLGKEGSEYVYTLPDQTKLDFNSAGRLSSETDRDGNATTLSYNGSSKQSPTPSAARSPSPTTLKGSSKARQTQWVTRSNTPTKAGTSRA